MKVIAICNLPDGIKLDHAWFTAEDGYYAQKVVIRPMPTKKVPVFDPNNCDMDEEYRIICEINGYNRCIDEIEGET